MRGRSPRLPESVIAAFLGFAVIGLGLGALFGADQISGPALTWTALGAVTVFVIWAVLSIGD
jgi:hypothetical protein